MNGAGQSETESEVPQPRRVSLPRDDDRSETDALVAAAKSGDATALEGLILGIQDRVYRLALRMVTRPVEAEDATQEILIRVMTRLSTFQGESAFETWVHRVAVNHLLDRKKTAVEAMELTFDLYAEDLRNGLASVTPAPDAELLVEEVKLSCTQAMLTCLDRDHRIAYVIGEIFEITSDEGAYICDVAPATYRKRLSRARDRVRSFVSDNCGLVNPGKASCRCERRVETAVRLGRIDPEQLEFATHRAAQGVKEMEALTDAADLMRSHPDYRAPHQLAERLVSLIRSGNYQLFDQDLAT